MRLSIITINYNGSESTIKLLASLAGQIDMDFQVIVVDNASEETDFNNLKNALNRQDLFKQVLPVKLIRNDQNLGFSGGNNVGIREAIKNSAEWVLLLNNDTWVEKDFIYRLRAVLEVKTGILGIPLKEESGVACAGEIDWLRSTLRHVYMDERQGERYKKNIDNLSAGRYYTIGGGVAISRDVLDKIGLLDENYFLYFEDVDYSIRARNNNIPISFTDHTMIYHSASATTKKLGSPLLLRYHYRNALYFNWKNGPWYIKLAVWLWSFWIIKKQLFKMMFLYKREESRAILNGVFDFYKGRMGKI